MWQPPGGRRRVRWACQAHWPHHHALKEPWPGPRGARASEQARVSSGPSGPAPGRPCLVLEQQCFFVGRAKHVSFRFHESVARAGEPGKGRWDRCEAPAGILGAHLCGHVVTCSRLCPIFPGPRPGWANACPPESLPGGPGVEAGSSCSRSHGVWGSPAWGVRACFLEEVFSESEGGSVCR